MGIQSAVNQYFRSVENLKGKLVVDIPAGCGSTSRLLSQMGADVEPVDLFPESFDVPNLTCRKSDLQKKLPFADASADYVVCQEGIEHISDQLFTLTEFARILKPGGVLLLTTPNISNFSARLNNLFTESESFGRLPAASRRAVRMSQKGDTYFGHIFLIGVQKIRILCDIAGFDIKPLKSYAISKSSLVYGIFLYPFLCLINLISVFRTQKRDKKKGRFSDSAKYWNIASLNINPTTLFGKHLIVECRRR